MMHFDILKDLECPKPVQHSQVYDWLQFFKPFGIGGSVKPGEEKDDNSVCGAAPGSKRYTKYIL